MRFVRTAVSVTFIALALACAGNGKTAPSAGSRSGGLATLQHLPETAHAAIAGPLADAFASTFVWALVLILVALIPAVGMAVSGWRRPVTVPAGGRPVVLE